MLSAGLECPNGGSGDWVLKVSTIYTLNCNYAWNLPETEISNNSASPQAAWKNKMTWSFEILSDAFLMSNVIIAD